MLQKLCMGLLLVGLSVTSNAQQVAPSSAKAVVAAAVRQAAQEHKAVFVIFHASWCGWCRKMDSAINAPECKTLFNDHYVIRHLTILESKDKKNLENPGADSLFKQYAPLQSGIPFWLIFNNKGEVVADAKMADGSNSGCPAAEEEVKHLIAVLQQTSSLSQAELDIIYRRFRKNDPDFTP
ncbi:hypothetical protein GCM10027051_12280 [Niabella terrae]